MKRYIKASDVADIQAKIAKKQAEIDKKTAWIQKKESSIAKSCETIRGLMKAEDYEKFQQCIEYRKSHNPYKTPNEYSLSTLFQKYNTGWGDPLYVAMSKAEDDAESIYNSTKAINEAKAIIEKYEAQVQTKQAKADAISEIPECLKEFMKEIVDSWDAHDIRIRDDSRPAFFQLRKEADKILYKDSPTQSYQDAEKVLKELYPNIPYSSYRLSAFTEEYIEIPLKRQFGISLATARLLWNKTDEQIHADNVKDGEAVILDLLNRVTKITGTVTDWDGLFLTAGNEGFATINGIVIGEEGKAKVSSITAGGYNIQRLHIRTIVKPAK